MAVVIPVPVPDRRCAVLSRSIRAPTTMQYHHRPPKRTPTKYIAGLRRPVARMSTCSTQPSVKAQGYRRRPIVAIRPRISTPPAARATHGGRPSEPFSVGARPQITSAARKTTMISNPSTIEARLCRTERGAGGRSAGCAALRRRGRAWASVASLMRDPSPRSAAIAMASPTSAIEPVTTTARFGASAAHARASSRASSSRSTACTRSAPTRAATAAARSAASRARSESGRVTRNEPPVRASTATMPVGVLVGEHAEHEDDLVEVEVLVERGDERLGAVRVVRGVDDHRRVAGDRLQAARRRRGGEALVHDLVGEAHRAAADERLDGRDRDGGVLGLVAAEQRQRHVAVLPRESADRHELAAHGDPRLEHVERVALDGERRLGELGRVLEHLERRVGLLRGHDGCRGLDDARLGARDLGDRRAEPRLVVEVDGREHGDLAVGDVRGVPLAAHADLEHDDVDGRVGEAREREHRERLEERQRLLAGALELGVDDRDERVDLLPVARDGLVGDGLAVDADALGEAVEVRAREQAGAQAGGAQQALDHATGRGLAVGARDVDDRRGAVRVAEQLDRAAGRRQSRAGRALADAGEERGVDGVGGVARLGVVEVGCVGHSFSRSTRSDEPSPTGARRSGARHVDGRLDVEFDREGLAGDQVAMRRGGRRAAARRA